MTKAKAIEILNIGYDGCVKFRKTLRGNSDDDADYLNDLLIALLTAIDTLKAEPVKHGRWIIDYAEGSEIYHAHCSECNNEPDRNIGGGYDYYIDKLSDYCPNCGARMDGDSE